jgi:hypothetical protein
VSTPRDTGRFFKEKAMDTLDPNTAPAGGATDPAPAAPPPPPADTNPVVATIRQGDISDSARKAVRLAFNPSGDERVTEIKTLTARLLSLTWGDGPEAGRCSAIARTNFETACMWAVKAATVDK